MKVKPTAEQFAAITAQGETLVSASAGSGKTFVMIEKIISLILEGKVEISSILAVTFTNLAALEMKEKLKTAIIKRINEEDNEQNKARLKYELSEIATSDICTVHSFCANLIRRFFYVTGVNGDFKIADDADAMEMQTRAADIVIDSLIEKGSEKFKLLLKIFAGSKGVSKIVDLLLPLYLKMRNDNDYLYRIESMPQNFTENGFIKVCNQLLDAYKLRASALLERANILFAQLEPFIERQEMSVKYAEFINAVTSVLLSVIKSQDLYLVGKIAQGLKMPSKPANTPLKRAENYSALQLDEKIDALKTHVKEFFIPLKNYEDAQKDCANFIQSGEITSAVCEFLLEFDKEYQAIKKRAGKMDFSDLEHCALSLLKDKTVQSEMQRKYSYIFVDEYQDVNPCQESILNFLQGRNMFRVGDVKQSIYGFRGCSAKFFVEEFEKLNKMGGALVLNGNFRSAPKILDAVNTIFSEVMLQETCQIDYKKTSIMTAGNAYPKDSGEVWFNFIPEKEKQEKKERSVYSVVENLDGKLDETYEEGAYVANIIAHELSKTHFDVKTGEMVKNQFKDIVILSRSKTGKASKIISELVKKGIPVASDSEYNICDYPEIKRLIEVLKYIDNPEQDIPLACALKSSLCLLSDEQLATIRLYSGKKSSFVEACKKYANECNDALSLKLKEFYEYCEKLRLLSYARSCAEIITQITSDTGAEIEELKSKNGEERIKRMARFISECQDLSVSDFLKRLKSNGYNIGFSQSGGENAVHVLTMHASKGLEFPVVIIVGMDNKFDDHDLKEKILLDDEWGFAPYYYDDSDFSAKETVLRALIKEKLVKKRVEDEMRLLYVATTRAQNTMHFVFKKRSEFDFLKVARAGKFSDFINFDKFENCFLQLEDETLQNVESRPLVISQTDKQAEQEILKVYQKEYAYESSLNLPVKSSASAILKAQGENYYTENQLFPESDSQNIDTLTGTAYHAFLENADFFADKRKECERVYSLLCKNPDFSERLSVEKMLKILQFPIFESLKGYQLLKEQEFLLRLCADEIFDTQSKDEILVQGFIDLLAVKENEVKIIDYKYSSHSDERLVKDYKKQLNIYAKAVKKILKIDNVTAYIININKLSCVQIPID